jgi:hypothetical protein
MISYVCIEFPISDFFSPDLFSIVIHYLPIDLKVAMRFSNSNALSWALLFVSSTLAVAKTTNSSSNE